MGNAHPIIMNTINEGAKFSTGQTVFHKLSGVQARIIERKRFDQQWGYRLNQIDSFSLYPINSDVFYPEDLLHYQPQVVRYGREAIGDWVIFIASNPLDPKQFSFAILLNGFLVQFRDFAGGNNETNK